MAKTKTKGHSKRNSKDILHSTSAPLVKSVPRKPQKSIEDLLTEAVELLEQSQADLALPLAEEALLRLEAERRQPKSAQKDEDIDIDELLSLVAQGLPTLPTALVLNAEILVALGNIEDARRRFIRATEIDKNGALISAEPWLWLAQLCEAGGRESTRYFEQACEVLRNEIDILEDSFNEMDNGTDGEADTKKVLDEKKAKLADALCAMAEVYMTDLSWEADAEIKCETLVTEAVAVCPDYLSAGVLQTLASVRISQDRSEDAKTALKRSLAIWHKDSRPTTPEYGAKEDEELEDGRRPDFATRVSLCRLLMEVQLEYLAMTVLEGLIREDDQSVESWYLGGWCQVLISQKPETTAEANTKSLETARNWLESCLRLYRMLDYEDERLKDHAHELVDGLKKELGVEGEMEEGGEDGWEDVNEDADEEDEDIELEIAGEVNGHAFPAANSADEDVEMS